MRTRTRIGAAAGAAALLAAWGTSPVATAASGGEGVGTQSWWYQGMGIPEAHKTSTGKGVTVAVIDGPIDPAVPELRGQDVTPVRSFCPGAKTTGTGAIASHGTSMVVNIVGNGRGTVEGRGIAGIAPDAAVRSYSVDEGKKQELQCSNDLALAQAIDAAVADGVDILSLSIGGELPSRDEQRAVGDALAAGVVVVAAAGSETSKEEAVLYPAAFPGVVAVGAGDRNAEPWSGNPKGRAEAVVILAPGVETNTGGFDGSTWRSDGFSTGSSMPTSLVAGGLALVAAKYPDATANQLIHNLIRNPGGSQTFGFERGFGYGFISVPKMLASDPTQYPDVSPLIELTSGAPGSTAASSGPSAGNSGTAPGSEPVGGEPVAAESAAEDGSGIPVALIVLAVLAVVVIGSAVTVVAARRRAAAPIGATPAAPPGWGGGGHG